MAIDGLLSEMDLPTLVQLACQEGHQAQLSIQHDGIQALLYFAEGNIVHAILHPGEDRDDLYGEEVVFQILGWEDGSFRLETGVDPPARTIQTPWSALLIEGLQRLDEKRWDANEIESRKEENGMATNLESVLAELGDQVPGFMATQVIGMDGLAIAAHSVAGINLEAASAQMTLLIKLVDTSVDKLKAGKVDNGLLTTERAYLLWRHLDIEGYFLGIAVDRSAATLGNLLLVSRIYAERVSKAMPR